MKIFAAVLLLTISVVQPTAVAGSSAVASNQSVSVLGAFSLCRAHPAMQKRLWVRGWFVYGVSGPGFAGGGLFNSAKSVPITTFDKWDENGNWKKYGALYAHIRTKSAVRPPSVILHGLLDCSSYRFSTDRDPFPPAQLKPVYGTARVGSGPISTSVTAGGLKLTLTVPRSSYPLDALARVTARIKNVSTHDVGYLAGGATSPEVQVLDSSGRIVFPPAMPYGPPLNGASGGPGPLHPGQTVGGSTYIVVRGSRIRASQVFWPTWDPTSERASNKLVTHPITVRLTSEPTPKLTLRQTAKGPVLDVTRPAGVGSPMQRLSYAQCAFLPSDGSLNFEYSYGWVDSGLHLTPGCSPLIEWHLRLGWLNHPVAALDYTVPQPAPTISPTPAPRPIPTAVSAPAGTPSFNDLLHRADFAMASVHTMRSTGSHTSVDYSAQMSLAIRADCRSQLGNGISIAARTLVAGRQSEAGRIDEGFIIKGPVLPRPHTPVHASYRSPATDGRWSSIDLYKRWQLDEFIPDPVWTANPAYLNQVCPDLVRLTYLAAPIPDAQQRVLGMQVLNGRQLWHIREHLWFTLDLYVDAQTFRLRRLVLWDGRASASHWRVGFDYSRFNQAVHLG